MILGIDMGNTNIVIGCIDDDKIYFIERLSTDKTKTDLEYAMAFKTVIDINSIDVEKIDGAIISSVVPQVLGTLVRAVEKVIGKTPYVVGPGVKTGLNVKMDNPKTVGSDLIVDAVAGEVAGHEIGVGRDEQHGDEEEEQGHLQGQAELQFLIKQLFHGYPPVRCRS